MAACADMETTHSQGITGRRAGEKNSKAWHLCPAELLQNESAMKLAAIQEKNATRT